MINRYSEERVVRRGALPPGDAPADEPWLRFDYVADDLTYPLAVRWFPEQGEIVLDHNKSAAIWRREASTAGPPPFGSFVRIDDLVPDALWCWPGVIDAHFRRLAEDDPPQGFHVPFPFHKGSSPLTLFRLGGYRNGVWHERRVCEEVNDVHFSPLEEGGMGSLWWTHETRMSQAVPAMIEAGAFSQAYERVAQYKQRVFMAPDAPAPSPLHFVDPLSSPDFAADYPDWMRNVLAKDWWPRPRQDVKTNEPLTPHAVSLDRKRLIKQPWTIFQSGHATTITHALSMDFMGLPVASTRAFPGMSMRFGPYAGGPYHAATSSICGVDGMEPSGYLPTAGVLRVQDYNEWLDLHTISGGYLRPDSGVDVAFQQRDFIDALCLFTRVADHGMPGGHRLNRPPGEQKFECVASPARFLGGRIVNSRATLSYTAPDKGS